MKLGQAAALFSETMRGYPGFWCVAGGWAIDLFLGKKTREHEDLEVVVLRQDHEMLFAHFRPKGAKKIFSGEPPRFVDLGPGPIDDEVIQLRLSPVGGMEFDLLLTPSVEGQWVCRRKESIRLPLEEARGFTAEGLPYLKPEIVLLFKAKYVREKDQLDFERCLPRLPPRPAHGCA